MGPATDDGFAEFARARSPELYRSAYLLCGNQHDAEDLVQEVLAKVCARWRRPMRPAIDNPAAYAQTALTRTFLNHRRKKSSGEVPYAEAPERGSRADPDHAAEIDARLGVTAALATLPPTDRAVVVLRYLEDLDVHEVAERTGLSAGAVRNRAMRSLRRLRGVIDASVDNPTPEEGR